MCCAHIPRDERKKLDVVSRRCVLVGYGCEVKGYRLYDPDRKKVFLSRDVKFNDYETGFKKESEPLSLIEPSFELSVESSVESSVEPSIESSVEPSVESCVEPSVELSRVVSRALIDEPVRKSKRIRHRPDYYSEGVSVAVGNTAGPISYQEAITNPKRFRWKNAMNAEMRSLQRNNVWELVELPADQILADILTKGLSGSLFEILRDMAGIVPIPSSFSV